MSLLIEETSMLNPPTERELRTASLAAHYLQKIRESDKVTEPEASEITRTIWIVAIGLWLAMMALNYFDHRWHAETQQLILDRCQQKVESIQK